MKAGIVLDGHHEEVRIFIPDFLCASQQPGLLYSSFLIVSWADIAAME